MWAGFGLGRLGWGGGGGGGCGVEVLEFVVGVWGDIDAYALEKAPPPRGGLLVLICCGATQWGHNTTIPANLPSWPANDPGK
ncbi:hypothetical protein JZ751_004182 [Albula glossodonta]|uniref:Uncharacterized protein n=1 Tax=Albula glossodonta TaxID=121402 RepID=A0A8T2N635_9TELE|nr:hypothetical protein JZ751_004182 [Albula glossodonta]